MFALRKLPRAAVPDALAKAQRYRLLNEPVEAESICLDVLDVAPDNQEAVVLLLLALTDQFGSGDPTVFARAEEALARLEGEFEREYYAGLVCERRGKTILRAQGRRAGSIAYDWLRHAMEHYEAALEKQPPGDDDATLRWNTCVRIIERHPHCGPDPSQHIEFGLE